MRMLTSTLAMTLLAWAGQAVAVDGPTPAPASVGALVAAQAPRAVSGDGRWRFDVDAGNVLQRVGIAPVAPAASVALPLSVTSLVVAEDGRRAALVSAAGCVGIVDVDGARPVAFKVRWLAVEQLPSDTVVWSAAPARRCERAADAQANAARWLHDGFGLRVAALSRDGRLLAIRAGVVDLDTGRIVARLPASISVGQNPLLLGLRFTDDDRALLALATPLSWDQASRSYAVEGTLVAAWELPSGALRRLVHLSTAEAARWAERVDDGGSTLPVASDAQRVASSDRLLAPLWRRPAAGALRGRLAAFPDDPAWRCMEWAVGASTFVRRDGTLWLDEFASIAQIDPATGRTSRRLSVARGRDVCALAVPAADGLFTWQGDSLALGRFEPAPGRDGDGSRVLDVRPGWHLTAATLRGDRVLAQWEATPGEPRPSVAARVKPVHVVAYDAATGRMLSDVAAEDPVDKFEGLDVTGRRFGFDVADDIAAICSRPFDPHHATWSLRLGDLRSFRGDECAAAPAPARTVFSSGLDLEPSVPTSLNWSQFRRRVLALDGAIGVVQDGLQLRVFDLARRRELGRIALADVDAVDSVGVLAAQGIVLVQARDAERDGKRQVVLSAYALAPGVR